jgi:hypothetical protein
MHVVSRSTQHFIILSSQRSGSTFIRIWLNQHPKIHCYGEVFLGHYLSADGFRAHCFRHPASRLLYMTGQARLVKKLGLKIIPDRLVHDYLDRLYFGNDLAEPWTDIEKRVNDRSPRGHKPLVGFKLMYSTLQQYGAVDRWIDSNRPKVIHITRENHLRKYVSLVKLSKTRVAHSKQAVQESPKVKIDANEFIRFSSQQKSYTDNYRKYLEKNMPYLEISYEDFFGDMAASSGVILEFLEVDNMNMMMHEMKKIGSEDLSEDVENWDELNGRLIHTEYARFLV